MDKNSLTQLVKKGLAAAKRGSHIAAAATSEMHNDVHNPHLKASLERGDKISREWAMRIDHGLKEVGGAEEQHNRIMEAHVEVAREIRQQAPDETVCDLGIIASGQLALHYWISAFGTLKAYAASAGLQQTAQHMATSVAEAKQADEELTQIAFEIMGKQAQRAA
jgi:ferritin-like metal-binding protein YciE